MKVGRNDPCPCGSGKKYKKCHLLIESGQSFASIGMHGGHVVAKPVRRDAVPSGVISMIRERETARRIREDRYGKVKDIISADFGGRRIVAVGNEIHYSPEWRTFVDFLIYYVRRTIIGTFGNEWFANENRQPESERHPIATWILGWMSFSARHPHGADGLSRAEADGPAAAYLNLAYDLYTLRNNAALQLAVVKRLRHRSNFQGARYELQITAAIVRAGFEIDFEDDSDNSRTHPEFIARERSSGIAFAVEAKSRRRPGVLGEPSRDVASANVRLGIRRLFEDALKKVVTLPFVIFIDVNLPPDMAARHAEWIGEVKQMLSSEKAQGWDKPADSDGPPMAALFLTNFPQHYGEPGAPEPRSLIYTTVPNSTRHSLPSVIVDRIEKALLQYGNIPSELPPDA